MESEFDQRQLTQMKFLITRLQNRTVGVSKFVADQWALVENLKEIDPLWKDNYYQLVNVIEDLYAVALDQGHKELQPSDELVFDETLKKMLSLLDIVAI